MEDDRGDVEPGAGVGDGELWRVDVVCGEGCVLVGLVVDGDVDIELVDWGVGVAVLVDELVGVSVCCVEVGVFVGCVVVFFPIDLGAGVEAVVEVVELSGCDPDAGLPPPRCGAPRTITILPISRINPRITNTPWNFRSLP